MADSQGAGLDDIILLMFVLLMVVKIGSSLRYATTLHAG